MTKTIAFAIGAALLLAYALSWITLGSSMINAQATTDVAPQLANLPVTAWLDKALALAGAILLICRTLAEILTKLAVTFNKPELNTPAQKFVTATWYLGKFIGMFGFDSPSEVKKDIKKSGAA